MITYECTPRERQAHSAILAPLLPPTPRPTTMRWPGNGFKGVEEDRCYEFVRECSGELATGRRLEALAAVWTFMREIAARPDALVTDDDGARIDGVSLNEILHVLLPEDLESVRRLGRDIVDTCMALAAVPGTVAETITTLHATWIKIYCALEGCPARPDADYLLIARVAAAFNPSLGGLSAPYQPAADIDATNRRRMDVFVAETALISYCMLDGEPAFRQVVIRYLFGAKSSATIDPGRDEVARFGDTLRTVLDRPTYEHDDYVGRQGYQDSSARVMGPVDGTAISADLARWAGVVAATLQRLPIRFTAGQTAIAVQVCQTIREVVQAAQPEPLWGTGPNWAYAIYFATSAGPRGMTLPHFYALTEVFAYYISIEKARDEEKTCWQDLPVLPEPDSRVWDVLLEGWSEDGKQDMARVHADVVRLRGSAEADDWGPAPSSTSTETGSFTLGPTYERYITSRARDGFWIMAETYATGAAGGPINVVEEPNCWALMEASVYLFELAYMHRRQWEDSSRDMADGLAGHLLGPPSIAERSSWAFRRALDVLRCRRDVIEADDQQMRPVTLAGALYVVGTCFPGCPTWYHLAQDTPEGEARDPA